MILRYFLPFLSVVTGLYQTYNGIVDGNACTSLTPSTTNTITFQAPTSNTNAGNIGITQLVFQAIGDGYTYAGGPIKINGVAGTYYRQCCTANGCDAESYAINSAAIGGECGLTWCGGDENQWQYVDYTGTSVATTGLPQNSTVTIDFLGSVPIALDGGDIGNPIYSISYNFVALPSSSPSSSTSITPSRSQTSYPTLSTSPTSSVTGSTTPTASITQTPTESGSQTPSVSITTTETPSITSSITTSVSITASETTSLTSSITSSVSRSPSETQTPSITQTPTESPSLTPSITPTSSETSSPTQTSSITPSITLTPSETSSITASASGTPSITLTPFETSSITSSTSVTPSETATLSQTASIIPTTSITPSQTRSQTPPSSPTRSPSTSPSGICYSVSALYGTTISLSSGWILVTTGINVTQAYGSGYISMGNFAGCSVVGSSCRCSYTQGSTVAGCSGKRNSYITYSYGATTSITYTNESPTCSYNFAGTIGIPPSSSPTPTLTRSASKTSSNSVSISATVSPAATVSPTATPPPLVCEAMDPSNIVDNDNLGILASGMTVKNLINPPPPIGALPPAKDWDPVAASAYHLTLSFKEPAPIYSCDWWANTDITHSPTGFGFYTTDSVLLYQSPDIVTPHARAKYSLPFTSHPNVSAIKAVLYKSTTWQIQAYYLQCYTCMTPSVTPTVTPTSSVTPSITASSSITSSVSRTSSITSSITPTVTLTSSPSSSITASSSITPSISPTSTLTQSSVVTPTASPSITSSPTTSLSPSPSLSVTNTPSHTLSKTFSKTPTATLSLSQSVSSSITTTASESQTVSLTITASGTYAATESSTPLLYCIPYPSITPTSNATASPTPLYMMTAWPSPGSATSSTTPLFMMIPYPSSSPKPINVTRINGSEDITGTIVGGTAVGALGIGSAYMVLRYLRPKKRQQPQNQEQEQEEQQEATTVKIGDGLPENVAHICVNSAELEEIKQILLTHRKPFRVLNIA